MQWTRFAKALAAAAFALTAAMATAGDAAKGRELVYSCLGCHGSEGYKNAYPKYSVPKLGGQNSAYVVAALEQYAAGNRSHPTMQGYATTLTPAERVDIAAYFKSAGKPGSRKPIVGQLPAKTELCVACHGQRGEGTLDEYPNINGQHADYLEQSLRDYRNGKRKDPIMAPFAQQLSDDDIEALAAHYARQPGLVTPPLR